MGQTILLPFLLLTIVLIPRTSAAMPILFIVEVQQRLLQCLAILCSVCADERPSIALLLSPDSIQLVIDINAHLLLNTALLLSTNVNWLILGLMMTFKVQLLLPIIATTLRRRRVKGLGPRVKILS